MFNHVALSGRLSQNPDVRNTYEGILVAHFELAVKAADQGKNIPPDYIPIVCLGEQAQYAAQYLHKGDLVHISGKITTREYTGRDGKLYKAVEITPLFFMSGADMGRDK